MVLNAIAPMTAGEPLQDAKIEYGSVAAADTFAKGNLLYFDRTTDTWKVTPASAVSGDFAVALEAATAASAAKKVRIQTGGRVTVIADGAIKGGNRVTNATATAGQVINYDPAGDATDIVDKSVGWYSGKEQGSDRDGVAIPDAADGDVIIITLAGRGGHY
jgi:hypothetical protein